MSIKITKLEAINSKNDPILKTTLYGNIQKTNNIIDKDYTYFDTFDGYDLFVNTNGDTLAVKSESTEESNFSIETDIEMIKNNYNVATVKYDDSIPAIIVKVNNDNLEVIKNIVDDFKDNKNYNVSVVTSQVLFLEPVDSDIQLEDDNLLNKLSDDAVKKIATDLGADNDDTKNKDSAMGFIKGKVSNKNN